MGFNFREAAQQFGFTHEEHDTGGTKFPRRVDTTVHHPETGEPVGSARYFPPKRRGGPVHIDDVRADAPGAGSAVLNEIESRHPGSTMKFLHEVKRNNNNPDKTGHAHERAGAPSDWDTHYPNLASTVHRGFSLRLPSYAARTVNSSSSTVDEHLKALHSEMTGSLGMHWTENEHAAQQFAHNAVSDHRTDVPVVLHATTPERKDIETRKDHLYRGGVFAYGDEHSPENEVPVRKGRTVKVTGISWRPDAAHPHADEHGWVHHTYPEPMHHTASVGPEEDDDAGSTDRRSSDLDQATGPEEPANVVGDETPAACSYCGSTAFEGLTDNGRVRQATCSSCGGTMSAHDGAQWTPELIGDPSNHPKLDADPRSGGVGGAAAVGMDPIVRDTSRLAGYTYRQTVQGPNGYEDREHEIEGPLYHGGRARLSPGDELTIGRKPNSWGDDGGKSTHNYFTTNRDTALSYAQQVGNRGRLYEVEPTGEFKMDHGADDFKSQHPLRVVREVGREEWPDWAHKQAARIPSTTCETCKGKGTVSWMDEDPDWQGEPEENPGKVHTDTCDDCGGSGSMPETSDEEIAASRKAWEKKISDSTAEHVRTQHPAGKLVTYDDIRGCGPRCPVGREWSKRRQPFHYTGKLSDPEMHEVLTRFGHNHQTGQQYPHREHTLTPVKHAGFKGYVEGYEGEHENHLEEDRELHGSRHPSGGFDEDLWDDTAPEMNTHEREHYEEWGEHPDQDAYDERHQEAYDKAKQEKDAAVKPVAHHGGVFHMLANEMENNYQNWHAKGEIRKVDLSQHNVYATQPHVVDRHVNRYLKNPGDTVAHVHEHGMNATQDEYPGTHRPMFVKHENNLFTVEGHHRTASALLRKEPIEGIVYDADKHGFPHYAPNEWGDEHGGEYEKHEGLQKHAMLMGADCDFDIEDSREAHQHALRHHDDGVCTATELMRHNEARRNPKEAAVDGPDWCTWRRAAQCTFPNDRNNTLLTIPQVRGACPWNTRYEQQICPISEPGPQALMQRKGSKALSWDEIGDRHPEVYGDSEIHGDAADGADGPGIGDAANYLAHERPGHLDAEDTSVHDLDFHEQTVHPRHIDYKPSGVNDPRVTRAREGYRQHPHEMPPLVLVKRHNVYQVADGHHRAEAAHGLNIPVRAYVAESPHPDEPFRDGDKAPFYNAKPIPKERKRKSRMPKNDGDPNQLKLFGSADADYRMQHQAPDADYGAPLHDVHSMMPDFYEHPEYYHVGQEDFWHSANVIRGAKGNPEKKIKIYRSLPAEHAGKDFNTGDWVSTSKDYARTHGRHHEDSKHDWPVISTTVPAKHLHTEGDVHEWGYNGPPKSGMVSFKGGYHQEVRQGDEGVVPVKRRPKKEASEQREVFPVFDSFDHVAVATQDLEEVREPFDFPVEVVRATSGFPMTASSTVDVVEAQGSEVGEATAHTGQWLSGGNGFHGSQAKSSAPGSRVGSVAPLAPGTDSVGPGSVFVEGGEREGLSALAADLGVHLPTVRDVERMVRVARENPEFGWHVTAAWSDVRNKAKRIRAEGKVMIKAATNEGLAGMVEGDHGTYENMITYRPGTRKIADWSCNCEWGDWAWKRIRFHGRQCSHSLALQYEAQSRGMFGREVHLGALTFGSSETLDERAGISDRPISVIARSLVESEEDPGDIMKLLMAYGLPHSGALQVLAEEEEHRRKCPFCGGGLSEKAIEAHKCPHCGHPIGHVASTHESPTYLRFGHWPEDERSHNNVTGFKEEGVSVYDLDHQGHPMDPDPHFSRGHEHDEHCEPNCDLDSWNEDYGNDTHEEMEGRVHRAERNRRSGVDRPGETGHLVKGDMVGIGHDGEPLLRNVKRVGDWIDHRHLLIPGAEKHHLARDPYDEEYEHPEGVHHTGSANMTEAEENERRKKHHHTVDTRRHAPEFGRGVPGWIPLPIGWCSQCGGWGCGHCGGTGQVAEDGYGHDANAVPDQNGDEGQMMSGGISDTSSLRTAKGNGPTCSGVALKAADTGRVLMLQRGLGEDHPAAGKWEIPGGHHEPGDTTSLHAGIREFEEEVGQPFPEGGTVHHTWTSPDGVYQGHVVVIPSEKDLSMKDGRVIPNPDDPKGDGHEQAAWWDIDHARDNPALRDEVREHTPWDEIASAGSTEKTASAWDPLTGEGDTPGFPYAAPQHSNSQNPASTGFATSEDPRSWEDENGIPDHLLPSNSYDSIGYYGMLHDHPEPALPSTDGDREAPLPAGTPIPRSDADTMKHGYDDLSEFMEDHPEISTTPETHGSIPDVEESLSPNQFTGAVTDIVAAFQATAGAKGIMASTPASTPGGGDVSFDFAAAARQYLAQDKGLQKSALKDFSFPEQQELINEGKAAGVRARNFSNLQIEGTHYEALGHALGLDDEDAEGIFS